MVLVILESMHTVYMEREREREVYNLMCIQAKGTVVTMLGGRSILVLPAWLYLLGLEMYDNNNKPDHHLPPCGEMAADSIVVNRVQGVRGLSSHSVYNTSKEAHPRPHMTVLHEESPCPAPSRCARWHQTVSNPPHTQHHVNQSPLISHPTLHIPGMQGANAHTHTHTHGLPATASFTQCPFRKPCWWAALLPVCQFFHSPRFKVFLKVGQFNNADIMQMTSLNRKCVATKQTPPNMLSCL